jgi:hemerythrin
MEELIMAVIWREHLSVGVPRIDEQHKELFRRFGILMDAINQGKGPVQVLEVLNFLDDYTVTHFHDEEKTMEEHRYPHLPLHREEHGQFCRDVEKLKNRITTEGFTQQNVLLTSRTLLRWLIQHICTTDKALSDHMKGRTRHMIAVPTRPALIQPRSTEPVPEADPEEKEFPFYYEDDVTS